MGNLSFPSSQIIKNSEILPDSSLHASMILMLCKLVTARKILNFWILVLIYYVAKTAFKDLLFSQGLLPNQSSICILTILQCHKSMQGYMA